MEGRDRPEEIEIIFMDQKEQQPEILQEIGCLQ